MGRNQSLIQSEVGVRVTDRGVSVGLWWGRSQRARSVLRVMTKRLYEQRWVTLQSHGPAQLRHRVHIMPSEESDWSHSHFLFAFHVCYIYLIYRLTMYNLICLIIMKKFRIEFFQCNWFKLFLRILFLFMGVSVNKKLISSRNEITAYTLGFFSLFLFY